MTKEELGKAILDAAYLTGEFTLRSGKKSSYYLDKYLFATRPDLLKGIAVEIAKRIPEGTDRLAGPELGAVSLAAAASLETGIPFVIVRKEEKGYGTSKRIEGKLEAGDKVVLLEDVMTTGGAAIASARALREAGAEILKVIGTIDREQGARANFEKEGLEVEAVFTKTELGI